MRLDMKETRTDAVLADLFGPDVFIVGGAVRDKLRESFHRSAYLPRGRDYVVVDHDPRRIHDRLGSLGTLVEVGSGFPVLKWTLPGEAAVDVAAPRRNRSLLEDQSSRDFRMNAIAVQLISGEISALPGAIDDIREKRICAINGLQSFADDPLRLLRAARFAGRFGFSVEAGTRSAMRDAAELLNDRNGVSAEQIGEELNRMLLESAPPSAAIRLLQDVGLLERVIPGLGAGAGVEQNQYHAYDVLGHNLATLDASRLTLESRWSALLHDIGKPAARSAQPVDYGYTFYKHELIGADMAQQVLRDLRLSNELVERVTKLVAHHMYTADPGLSDHAIRRFINRIDPSLLDDQFHLRHCDKIGCGLPVERTLEKNQAFQARVYEILGKKQAKPARDLAIGGHEVFERVLAHGLRPPGATPGPEVGVVLRRLREFVSEQPGLNTVAGLDAQVARIIEDLKFEGLKFEGLKQTDARRDSR